MTFNATELTVFDVFDRAIREAGFEARITSRNNYVASINGPNGWLGEFDNGPNSGWMYMVNGVHPNLGLSEQVVRNGDVIIWHFTDDYTQETSAASWGPPAIGGGTQTTATYEEEDEEEEEILTIPNAEIPLAELENWENPFDDVSGDVWFFEAVRFVNIMGLMGGTDEDTFAPNMNLSRAMLITILARAAGADTTGGETWYSQATQWGVGNGITDGLNLRDDITREQLVTMLFRYANMAGVDTTERADISRFSDADDVSEWAYDAMAWAIATQLVQGRAETTIAPTGTATRAETATILMRFINNVT